MAKITFGMSWNYDEQEYNDFLISNRIIHLKKHEDNYFKVGDAIRTESGTIARIVDKFNNYENCSHDYTIANNNLSIEQMYYNFKL